MEYPIFFIIFVVISIVIVMGRENRKKELLEILKLIDAAENIEKLDVIFNKFSKFNKEFQETVSIAYQERVSVLTTGQGFSQNPNPKEEKVRKFWLYIFVLNLVSGLFSFMSSSSFVQKLYGLEPRRSFVVYIFLTTITSGIIYYCAYKRKGTKLLLLLLLSPLSILYGLIIPGLLDAQVDFILENPILFTIGTVIAALFWCANLSLRKINLLNKPTRKFLKFKVRALSPSWVALKHLQNP